jgi:chorismate--pyruvate lyase
MKDDFGIHAFEPVWHHCDRLRRHALSAGLRHWLVDDSSLTRRLRCACPGRFRVELIAQRMERPMLSEARALARPPREIALVRQVWLLCDERPWVFARTVIPLPSLHGGLHRLAMLGTRPLGEVLFADPRMQRQPLEIARVTPRHRLFHMATARTGAGDATLWGRRSVFRLQEMPLLVSEFFLPALVDAHEVTG